MTMDSHTRKGWVALVALAMWAYYLQSYMLWLPVCFVLLFRLHTKYTLSYENVEARNMAWFFGPLSRLLGGGDLVPVASVIALDEQFLALMQDGDLDGVIQLSNETLREHKLQTKGQGKKDSWGAMEFARNREAVVCCLKALRYASQASLERGDRVVAQRKLCKAMGIIHRAKVGQDPSTKHLLSLEMEIVEVGRILGLFGEFCTKTSAERYAVHCEALEIFEGGYEFLTTYFPQRNWFIVDAANFSEEDVFQENEKVQHVRDLCRSNVENSKRLAARRTSSRGSSR